MLAALAIVGSPAAEIARMERAQPPMDASNIETRLHDVMVSGGWALLYAKPIALLILRFLR